MKTLKVIIIGAGGRGSKYAQIMANNPDKYTVVAVCDPIDGRRKRIKELFSLSDDMCFDDWETILSRPKMADLAVIATMDELHYAPTMKAIEAGYDIMLEKPVAQTAQECADIALAAQRKGVKVLVCHVLRYAPFYKKVKELLMSDTIGEIISAVMVEAVGNIHQSHSFIRGDWHSEKETTPMLLAKSCHDLDIAQWLINKPCKKVQSFGSLTYFIPENAPQGAPKRCADGNCPAYDTCPYNCIKLYYEDKDNLWFRRACAKGIAKEYYPTDEEVMHALQTTDYGLCVFQANNDVVDHQVVNMEFEGGITISFSMNCFNKGGRYIRIFGTKGELYAHGSDPEITVYTFSDKETKHIPVLTGDESIVGGHGGGDEGIIAELYDYMGDDYNGIYAGDISVSVKNHLIGFAAEDSRHSCSIIELDEYFKRYGFSNK